MSAPDGGDVRWLAAARDAWAVFREVWVGLVTPAALGWWGWRRWSAARADERAKEGRTEQQRRDDAFNAKFARLDEQVKQHVAWLETRAERAEKRADDADARADAAERERWRLELWARDLDHAMNNARQIADDARAKSGQPPVPWQSVPRPKPPSDLA